MSIPETMSVVEITASGPPEALRIGSRPVPVPGAGEVLIRVAAAGVNRADTMQRKGNYPPPPGASDIPGLEVSGTVRAVGGGGVGSGGGRRCVCASCRRRVRRVLRGAGAPVPADPGIRVADRCRSAAGGVRHGLDQRHRPRPTAGRRVVPRARRIEWHRHRGHSTRAPVRGARLRHRRDASQVRDLRGARRRARDLLSRGGLHGRGARGDRQPGRRSHPGHGGRRLPGAQPGQPRRGGAPRDHRAHGGRAGGAGPRAPDVAPSDGDRRDAARALGGGEGGDSGFPARACWPQLASGALRPIVHATYPLAAAAEAHRVMESSVHTGKLLLVP